MKAISHRWVGVAALLSAVVIATCGAAARVVIPFTIDPANITVPRDARALTSHEAAVRGLTAILVRDLGLPMPTTFTLYVYGGRPTLSPGPLQGAPVAPARAPQPSPFPGCPRQRRPLLLHGLRAQPPRPAALGPSP